MQRFEICNVTALLRRVMAWTLAGMLVLAGAIAPGTMLAQSERGLVVVLCVGSETVSVTLDSNGEPMPDHHDLCDWQSLSPLSILRHSDALQLVLYATKIVPRAYAEAVLRPATPYIFGQPRAPPRLL